MKAIIDQMPDAMLFAIIWTIRAASPLWVRLDAVAERVKYAIPARLWLDIVDIAEALTVMAFSIAVPIAACLAFLVGFRPKGGDNDH